MAYTYVPTPIEQAYADYLEERGWSVTSPQCPECHGYGRVWPFTVFNEGETISAPETFVRCSRGCPAPTMFLLQG